MLDQFLQLLVKFPGLVIEHSDVCVPGHVVDVVADCTSKGIEPIVLRQGTLSPQHARHLIELAIVGSPFAIDEFRGVEVLFDHRWAYDQAMLVHHRLEDIYDALFFSDGAPVCMLHTTIVGMLLDSSDDEFREHATAVVGLAKNQLDVVLFGDCYERFERFVIVTAKKASRCHEKHPAVQQLQDCVRRFVLAAA